MLVDELDLPFDQSLVATHPAEPRDSARLLVFDRARETIAHHQVRDLTTLLKSGDALVINATRVVPARVRFEREDSGGRLEGLVLPYAAGDELSCYLKNARRIRAGQRLVLLCDEKPVDVVFEVLGREAEVFRLRLVEGTSIDAALERAGRTPLPPYILGARRERGEEDDAIDRSDRNWYHTVFEHAAGQRSVAAPTAGLHFTKALLEAIRRKGVEIIEIELEVGPGTFKPVTATHLADHPMHHERFRVETEALAALEAARARGGRVVSVGTTSCRTLESLPQPLPGRTIEASTDLLIAPGHVFTQVDALMTNFHLPRSTLLALVAALIGLDSTRRIYHEAVEARYRFYSYGDAMLIL